MRARPAALPYALAVLATGAAPRSTVSLDDLRVAGGLMLVAAAALPALGAPGLPCPLRSLTGLPCPLCGMTRSVTATVHLRVGEALAMNPAGVVVVAVAVALLVYRRPRSVTVPAWVAPLVVGLLWGWQLWRFPVN